MNPYLASAQQRAFIGTWYHRLETSEGFHRDWRQNPWFTPEKRYEQCRFGFTRKEIDQAIAGLELVYPPEIALEMMKDADGSRLVAQLFFNIVFPNIIELIDLGLDVSTVRASLGKGSMKAIRKLREPLEFASYRSLTAVWAMMCRAGLDVDHEAPSGTGSKPDLRACVGVEASHLEVKTLYPSMREMLQRLSSDRMFDGARLAKEGWEITIEATPALDAVKQTIDAEDILGFVEALAVDVRTSIDRLLAEGPRPGVHDAGKWMRIRIVEAPLGKAGVFLELFDGETSEGRAKRVVEQIRSGARQLPTSGLTAGAVLVFVGRYGNPELMERMLREAMAEKPLDFAACDAAIILGEVGPAVRRRQLAGVVIRMSKRDLGPGVYRAWAAAAGMGSSFKFIE